MLVSFSPPLLLSVAGLIFLVRNKEIDRYREVVIWIICGFILIYFPFTLQRRFLLGFYIPVSILSVIGMKSIFTNIQGRKFKLFPVLLAFSIITNAMLILFSIQSVRSSNQRLVLTNDEYGALDWIEISTDIDDRILSSPEMGTYIPALTGRRVVYGHPFETVNAKEAEESVIWFYTQATTQIEREAYLERNKIDYIFYGPRENEIGELNLNAVFTLVFQSEFVSIYSVKNK